MQRDQGATAQTVTALEGILATTEAAAAATPSKDLLELQEKITKEILSSKLQEAEMKELQVGGEKHTYSYLTMRGSIER